MPPFRKFRDRVRHRKVGLTEYVKFRKHPTFHGLPAVELTHANFDYNGERAGLSVKKVRAKKTRYISRSTTADQHDADHALLFAIKDRAGIISQKESVLELAEELALFHRQTGQHSKLSTSGLKHRIRLPGAYILGVKIRIMLDGISAWFPSNTEFNRAFYEMYRSQRMKPFLLACGKIKYHSHGSLLLVPPTKEILVEKIFDRIIDFMAQKSRKYATQGH